MTTFERAIDIVHKELPDVLIINCFENDRFYFFNLQSNCHESVNEFHSVITSCIVQKETGQFDHIDFDLWKKEEYDKGIVNDSLNNLDYSEISYKLAPLSKETFIELAKKEGFTRKIVGYTYSEDAKIIFPRFMLPDDPYDIPTDGGTYYYDIKHEKWGWMELLEYCEYSGLKTVRFEAYISL